MLLDKLDGDRKIQIRSGKRCDSLPIDPQRSLLLLITPRNLSALQLSDIADKISNRAAEISQTEISTCLVLFVCVAIATVHERTIRNDICGETSY